MTVPNYDTDSVMFCRVRHGRTRPIRRSKEGRTPACGVADDGHL